MAINGNTILVYNGSTLIGGMKSNDVQTDADLMEISSPGSNTTGEAAWKYFIAGRKEGSIQVGYLVLSNSALGIYGGNGIRDLLQVGNSFTLKFKARNATDGSGVQGVFILKTCKINSVRGNLVSGSFMFKLNGPLT